MPEVAVGFNKENLERPPNQDPNSPWNCTGGKVS